MNTDMNSTVPHSTNPDLHNRIVTVLASTQPLTKERNKALAKIKWRMRGPSGEFVGLNDLRCAFVPESGAMIFDGRDSETCRLATYQATLGPLRIELI